LSLFDSLSFLLSHSSASFPAFPLILTRLSLSSSFSHITISLITLSSSLSLSLLLFLFRLFLFRVLILLFLSHSLSNFFFLSLSLFLSCSLSLPLPRFLSSFASSSYLSSVNCLRPNWQLCTRILALVILFILDILV